MRDVTLEITFPLSPKGRMSRVCRGCGGKFQIQEPKVNPKTQYCPYCEAEAGFDQFMTPDQEKLVQSLIFAQLEGQMSGIFDASFAKLAGLEVSPEGGPKQHDYEEVDLGEANHCYHCHMDYAIEGDFKVCPHCGKPPM